MSSPRTALLSLLAVGTLLAAVPLARADVLVVDASGGGEYKFLLDALADAQDGDTLLLRPGDYVFPFEPPFVITDRSLTLAGDGTGTVQIGAIKVVQNVPGKRVVLRGLTATLPGVTGGPEGLLVQGGEVLAEDCRFKGRDGTDAIGGTPGMPAVRVDSGHLVLARCAVQGGRGQPTAGFFFFPATPGGPGLVVTSRASVYGGTILGGEGGFAQLGGPVGVGAAGGPGVFATNGLLFLAGTTVTGGAGGFGDAVPGGPTDYAGGDAVHLDGVCDLQQLGVTLVPGAGGHIVGLGTTGPPGDAIDGPLSTVTTHPGPYRSYALGPPTPEGEALQLDYSGSPGDLLAIFVAPAPATLPLPAKQGLWHLGAPLFGPYVMSAPSGTLSLSIPIAGAGFGPEGAVLLYEQVFVKPASGPALLSSPSTHLIVDGSL